MMLKLKFSFLFLLISLTTFSQRGKDGDYNVSALNTQVNTYTQITVSAVNPETYITVADNKMNGASFSGDLEAGDLLLVYHVQGVYVDVNTGPITVWGTGNYTVQDSWWNNSATYFSPIEYGAVTNYWSAGKFEFVEVKSVSGNYRINITCPLKYNYYAGGQDHPQVVRIPRYKNLTVPNSTSITCPKWDGTTGGVVAIEVDEDLNVNGTGKISADESGFRGGVAVNTDFAGPVGAISDTNSRGFLGSNDSDQGSGKGESIYGNVNTDYVGLLKSPYGYGAVANGGGGGNYHNAGGGGGSNVGVGKYYSYGVVNRGPGNAYDPAWNLESSDLINKPSSGGGRGGYSHSKQAKNPLIVGPHNISWDSDYRRISGGVGGHPLSYAFDRAYMGGGGGAGHGNDGYGGDGGDGGGVVFINVYGNIAGNGTISANGEIGESTEGADPGTFSNSKTGEDGAGGAGGGGAILVKNINTLPNTLKIEAKGGLGGDEVIKYGGLASGSSKTQADGPGGGGAGGLISFSTGSPTQNVSGGLSGTTSSGTMSNFPVNGATGGADGMDSQVTNTFDIIVENDTICKGENVTLTPTVIGNPLSTPTLYWYVSYSSTSALHVGSSYTTPNLTVTTTYYVGNCDAAFRVPVEVYVSPDIIVSGVPPTIVDETCSGNDGSITGITASGGTGNLSFDWNGNVTPTEDLTNSTSGSFTLTITDKVGCTATSGPHTIGSSGGPVVDVSNILITDETCTGSDGAISGITASGGTGTLVYSWSPSGGTNVDMSGVTAGDYTLTITDDANCTATSGPHTIAPATPITIDATNISITDETCTGNDGAISGITTTGGTGTLVYSWSPSGGNSIDMSGAIAGDYTLTITDDANCTATSGPHTIDPSIPITVDASNILITNETCTGNDGAISGITTTGGTGTLVYSWSPSGGNSIDMSGAIAGDYTLTITDDANCNATSGPHTIDPATPIIVDDANILISDESCIGNDGSITGITASGGTGSLTYSWSPIGGSNIDISGVIAGVYTLTVTDAANCTATSGPHTINASIPPTIDDVNILITNETCTGNDGSISGITVSGGTGPYIYDWNGTIEASIDVTGAVGGTYNLTITDNNGCTATAGPYSIGASPGPSIDDTGILITDETCNGNDGSITGITVSGGLAPYTFEWNGNVSPTIDLTGTTGGSYTLVVTDDNGCTATVGPYIINSEPPLIVDESAMSIGDETCNGNNGSITGITISGGTGALNYSWSPSGANSQDLTGVAAGDYTLTVTDSKGCSATSGPHTINLIPAPVIDGSNVIITDANCGLDNGSITGIILTGGTSPFTYDWNGVTSTGIDLVNVAAGSYNLTVTDNNGCVVSSGPHIINGSTGLSLDDSGVLISAESCVGNDGSITGVTVINGTLPLNYHWNGNISATIDLNNATADSYTLTVEDANGCTSTAGPFVINDPILPNADIYTSDQIIEDGESVQINSAISPSNGTISWNPTEGLSCNNCKNPVATPDESTWYIVTVTSINGCTDQDSIFIEIKEPCGEVLFPTIFSPNGDGLNDDFCVIGNCIYSMKLQIYDRWGEKIFESTDVNDCWDGTYRGKKVNTGVYVYKFIGTKENGSTIDLSGNVNVVR